MFRSTKNVWESPAMPVPTLKRILFCNNGDGCRPFLHIIKHKDVPVTRFFGTVVAVIVYC